MRRSRTRSSLAEAPGTGPSDASRCRGLEILTPRRSRLPAAASRDRAAAARPVRPRRASSRSRRATRSRSSARAARPRPGRRVAARIARRRRAGRRDASCRVWPSASTARRMRPRSRRAAVDGRRSSVSGHAPAVPARPRRLADGDRRRRRRGGLRARAGQPPDQGHVPAAEPADQRPRRRDDRRRGRPPERRPDHGVLGARAGTRLFIVPGRSTRRRRPAASRGSASTRARPASSPAIPQLIDDLGLVDDGAGSRPARRPRPQRASLDRAGSDRPDDRPAARREAGAPSTSSWRPRVSASRRSLGALTLLELRGLATSTYGRYRPAGRLATRAGADGHRGGTRRRSVARPRGPC